MTTTNLTSGLARVARGVGVGSGQAQQRTPRPRRRLSTTALTLGLLVAPSVLLLLIIHGYPLVYAAVQATHNGNLIQLGEFVGFDNFVRDLQNPVLWHAALFTLIFTVVGVFGSWIIGLALALMLRQRVHLPGLFKTLLFIPWIVPVVVSSTAWNWLVATPDSPIPLLFKFFGMNNVLFLADPTLAQLTVCLFKVWISFPFMMLMASSALTS